jgi:hypothetical protein
LAAKQRLQDYVNNNPEIKAAFKNNMSRWIDKTKHSTILKSSVINNPNNLVYGPNPRLRVHDLCNAPDREAIAAQTPAWRQKFIQMRQNQNLGTFSQLSRVQHPNWRKVANPAPAQPRVYEAVLTPEQQAFFDSNVNI